MAYQNSTKRKIDVVMNNRGTIWTFTPVSDRARRWIKLHVQGAWEDTAQAEHRSGTAIAEGMLSAGLVLQDGATGRVARARKGDA